MFFLIYFLGGFSALFFFFFCQNFANNFPYLIPPTNSGSKASLGPSGPVGLASNPVQQLSKASLGQVGLFTIPLGFFSTGHLGPPGPTWIFYPPEGTWLSSLSWPIWPCGACNPSCSKPIQALTGPIWLLHHPCSTISFKPLLAHLALWGLHPSLFNILPKPHWPNLAVTASLSNFWQNLSKQVGRP